MQPQDLASLQLPSDPNISPDGSRIVYVVTGLDLEQDRYVRSLWLWEAGEAKRLTHGPNDSYPRWSPDGMRIAFLRGDSDLKPQVAVIGLSGEASVLTDFELGCEEVEWSPDGKHLAAVVVSYTEEWSGLSDEERNRRPRRMDSIPFRFDAMGWIHDRRRHVWLIDLTSSEGHRLLTDGPFDERMIAWYPDSSRIAFATDRNPRRGLERGSDLYSVAIAGGELQPMTDRGFWGRPAIAPDGTAFGIGDTDPKGWPSLMSLWRLDAKPIDLTGHLDRNIYSPILGTTPGGVQWTDEGCITVLEDSGRVGVVKIHGDGRIDHLVGGDRAIKGVTATPSGSHMAFVASEPTNPGDVYLWESGEETRLTYLNENLDTVEADHFTVVSGGVEVDAWIYLPPGESKVPSLISIHGGPASQYGFGFFDEFQVYAGAGMGVIACNPRGSTGKGLEHVRAVVGEGWGTVDVEDIENVLAEALQREPRLDGDRVGIMGGSYGGFLTAWMIAKDQRYSSAVVERALLSFTSFSGTSDIGATFPVTYTGTRLTEDHERLWAMSPLSIAHNITTPTLILHSENDFRCPIEQAEQLFMVLKERDVAAELLRFPGEGHELSRSGKPRHRVERFEAVLDWHSRHLMNHGMDLAR